MGSSNFCTTCSRVTATDSAFPFEVWTYAFRQSGGIGSLVVDNLKIGTAFSDVITPRPGLTITHSGSDIQITWPAAFTGYTLQYKGDLSAATLLFEVLDRFDAGFSIVEPRRQK